MGKAWKRIGNIVLLFFLFIFSTEAKISVSSYMDGEVSSSIPFKLIVNITAENESISINKINLKFPKIDGIKKVGSYSAQSSSFEYINGKVSKKKSIIITYELLLSGTKKKNLRIPSILVKIKGKTYKTAPINISFNHLENNKQKSNKKVFIQAVITNKSPYLYEKFNVSYYLYVDARYSFSNISLESKDGFSPFISDTVYDVFANNGRNLIKTSDVINGKRYKVMKLLSYDFIAQKSGKIAIPVITLRGILVKYSSIDDNDFFSSAFDDFDGVTVFATNEKVVLSVKKLPEYDGNLTFSNIVGMDITGQNFLNEVNLKTGNAYTYTIKLKGLFFKKIVEAPQLDGDDDWEIYEPQRTEEDDGVSFKYMIVPKNIGKLSLPLPKLVYFDTIDKKYKKILFKTVEVNVAKGIEQGFSDNGQKKIGQNPIKLNDIYFLKDENEVLKNYSPLVENPIYIFLLLLSFVPIFLRIYKDRLGNRYKTDKKYRNLVEVNNLLKKWRKEKNNFSGKEFFSFAHNILYGYLIAKFNIEEKAITTEKLIDKLSETFNQNTIEQLKNIFELIAAKRFAPIETGDEDELKKNIDTLISKLERGDYR